MLKEIVPSQPSIAPLLGAAGATLAFSAATRRFNLHPEKAAFGGAALAFMASCATDGETRAFLRGASAASLALGLAGLGRVIQQTIAAQMPLPVPVPPTPSTPVDAITSSDLQQALARVQAKSDEVAAERERQHAAEVDELQSMVRGLLDHLHTANSENAQLRAQIDAGRSVEHADRAQRSTANATQGPTTIDEVTSPERTENPSVAAHAPLASDAVARLSEVSRLLDEYERQRLSLFNATAPSAMVEATRQQLLRRTPTDAVAYLRSAVLPTIARESEVRS